MVSRRGARGGYALQRPAREINLAELLDSLDDSFQLAQCTGTGSAEVCSQACKCPVKEQIAEVHGRIRQVLQTVTLLDLLRGASADPGTRGSGNGQAANLPG